MAIVVARRPTTSEIQFNNKPDDLLLKDRRFSFLYCVATLNVELSLNCLVTVTVTAEESSSEDSIKAKTDEKRLNCEKPLPRTGRFR